MRRSLLTKSLPGFVLEFGSMALTLVLASNSPRRRRLLALTGWSFDIRPVEIDESPRDSELPADYVMRLAADKALAALKSAGPGQVILTADTTVADGERVLGKPADAGEAMAMLRSLRDREHFVYTAIGVSQLLKNGQAATGAERYHLETDVCATRVWMRGYSDAEIEAYIAGGDPFDKAGAYAIQNREFHPVERIEGCYPCVVGLPVCRAVRLLARFHLSPPQMITAGCAEETGTGVPCQVYQRLLQDEQDGAEPGDGIPQGKGK